MYELAEVSYAKAVVEGWLDDARWERSVSPIDWADSLVELLINHGLVIPEEWATRNPLQDPYRKPDPAWRVMPSLVTAEEVRKVA